jgi:bifunctional UDP-N-acetylglucosamine pyrophosphorylase/glucosamine-1-phosphate N-acetyltransferase
MRMADLHVVVLAAGMGTRMKSALPKVLHRVAGQPMIDHVLRTASRLATASTTVVVGHGAEQVRAALKRWPDVRFVLQEPQLGTGHALLQAAPVLEGRSGTLLLLSGDVPLLQSATLAHLLDHHDGTGASLTVLSAMLDRPFGYGRIVRSKGRLTKIVEERDATTRQKTIKEINSGIYAIAVGPVFEALRGLSRSNAQAEYYLPDLVVAFRERGGRVETVEAPAEEIRGVNSRAELAEVSRLVRQRKTDELMAAGVTIEDPATTYIDVDVTIGADTVVHPAVSIERGTRIGTACEIHSGVRIADSEIGDGVTIQTSCVIESSRIAARARVGPFAHLRPETDVREDARIGNFVELKKTVLGAGSKANHLAYLGDASIGERVNVGAGTITCNYDGSRKHPTIIEDGAFIGSDTQLIAPVRVGRGAYIAAGSSITQDVPAGALGIARGRQVNKEGWAEKDKSE